MSAIMCVDDGWFKQPHLAESDGWVRLHTCCTLSDQCAQVTPAIPTLKKISSRWKHETPGHVTYAIPLQTPLHAAR